MRVFIIPFHVRRMGNSIMPSGFSGAYAKGYAPGSDYLDATSRVLKKLALDGLYLEEILQPIHEMNSESWSQHISEMWPDQASSLLGQIDFENVMKRGGVVYGPFGSYM